MGMPHKVVVENRMDRLEMNSTGSSGKAGGRQPYGDLMLVYLMDSPIFDFI